MKNKIIKFQKALRKSKPIKELLSIAEEEFFLGENKSKILKEFDLFCDSLEDNKKIDTVLDSMDIIDGWCSPDKDISINKSDVSVKEILSAFDNLKDAIDYKKRVMLKIHYQRNEITHSDLAQYAGISSPKLVNIEYGKLGHLLCKELHYPAIIERKQGYPIWRSIFVKKKDKFLLLDNKFSIAIKQLDWILNTPNSAIKSNLKGFA